MQFLGLRSGVVGVWCAVLVTGGSNAATRYVDVANCPAPGDGTPENPFCSIQVAIVAAFDGDEIVVAPGTYSECIDFLGKAVWLHSSGGPEVTVIDGTGYYHVVQCVSGEWLDTVLDGFTITGGNANGPSGGTRNGGGMYNYESSPTVTNCTFEGNTAVDEGGGMYNENSSPTVTDCTFGGNEAGDGGGMYNRNSSPTVSDCTFTGNWAYTGGAMYNRNSSPTVTDCTFSENSAAEIAAGMYNHLSSATVTDCTFIGNTAHEQGGGMYNTHSSPMVLACNFVGNSAVALRVLGASSGGGPSSGGGMYNFGGSPTVHLCSFWMNTAAFGGGMGNNESAPIVTQCAFDFNSAAYGGGMSNETSSPAVTACVFDTNIASQFGGGMQNSSSSNPTVTGCSFVNNAADGGGGGMDNFASSPTVINCTFHENTVTNIGGAGIYNTNSNPSVINCTFTFNVGPAAGGMYSWANSSPVLANCILWGDSPDEFGGDGTPTVMYSNVQGGWDGNGSNNIDADPLFADPASGYLHLSSGSPCIDAGDNTAVPPDTLDLDGDGDTAEPVPFDLDGNPRFVDDPSTPDSGNGNPPLVDMGAYEFPPAAECAGDDDCPPGFLCIDGECVPYCPWDLEGDGNVGITDFLALLASWGSCDEIFTVQTAPPSESHLAIVDRDGCDIGSLPTQMAVMLGMGFDPSTDTLFATGIGAGSPSLYEIDRMSGVYTLIGTTGTIISAISIHPVTFDLYGMTLSGSLYLIDKTDGSLTLLGSDPVDLVEANGMTFSPDGTLYVSDTSGDGTSDLFVVDPATGDASLHVTIDRNSVAGLDFGADGVLYGTDNQTDTVITIDLGSGTATEVCPFGLGFGHPTLELAPGVGGPGPDCAADLDGDGVVGITDFLALLAHWGPCP